MSVSDYLGRELESHSCVICYEMMQPPDRPPMLLFPCGHTTCKICLLQHTANHHNKTCPLCRTPIKSSAVNISLQQLIQSMQAKREALKAAAKAREQRLRAEFTSGGLGMGLDEQFGVLSIGGDGENGSEHESGTGEHDVSRYIQVYNQYSLRCAVLSNKLDDLAASTATTTESLHACQLVTRHLDAEEERVVSEMKRLQAELDLIRQHRADQETKAAELERQKQRGEEQAEQIRKIVGSLERERDKAFLIVGKLAPHIKLQPPVPRRPTLQNEEKMNATKSSQGGNASTSPTASTHLSLPTCGSQHTSSASASASRSTSSHSTSTGPSTPWPFPANPGRYYQS